MKLFTTRKHNTVECPKMHNFQNGIYQFFRGYNPISLYLVPELCASSPIEIYVTIGLGKTVSENEILVTIILGIFVLENYTWPFPRNYPEGMGGYTQPTLKKLNLSLNVSHKFTH